MANEFQIKDTVKLNEEYQEKQNYLEYGTGTILEIVGEHHGKATNVKIKWIVGDKELINTYLFYHFFMFFIILGFNPYHGDLIPATGITGNSRYRWGLGVRVRVRESRVATAKRNGF